MGIVERGLEDLRTGEVRVRAGDARLEGEALVVRPGEDLVVRPGEDLVVRPGEALRVETDESVLAVEAVLIAALLLPPTVLAAVATGIAVFAVVFVVTVSTASFFERPRVVRRGLSIISQLFSYFFSFYLF